MPDPDVCGQAPGLLRLSGDPRPAKPAAAIRVHRRLMPVLALAGLACTPAQALQVVDAEDGVAVEAIVSTREPTRIRIDGATITDVVGSVHASGCGPVAAAPAASPVDRNPAPGTVSTGAPAPHPLAEVLLECDLDKGEIYLRPLGDSRKPVNLFVSSAHATYTLVLRRADTPADTIVLRDRRRLSGAARTLAAAADAGSPVPPALPPAWSLLPMAELAGTPSAALPRGAVASHVRGIKSLLVAMVTHRVPADISVDELLQPMQLWSEARLTLVRRFEGRGLVGELYLLQNVSATPMVVTEPEFDRPDDAPSPAGASGHQRQALQPGPVLGIAIASHTLLPGEQTTVYVIRQGVRP